MPVSSYFNSLDRRKIPADERERWDFDHREREGMAPSIGGITTPPTKIGLPLKTGPQRRTMDVDTIHPYSEKLSTRKL